VLAKINSAATQLQEILKGSEAGPKFTTLLDNLLKISDDISAQRGTLARSSALTKYIRRSAASPTISKAPAGV